MLPFWGSKCIDQVTTTDLLELQQRCVKNRLSPATTDRITHSAVRGFLRDAKLAGYAVRDLHSLYDPNLISRLSSDDDAGGEIDPFTEEERDRIEEGFRLHDPDYYMFVRFRFWTGTRPSETIGLRVPVDLVRRRFRVVTSRVLGRDGATKTKRRRVVVIHKVLAQGLKHYLAAHPRPDGNFLFTTPRGAPIDEANFYDRHWLPMLKRLKIRRRPFYNARHTYISYLVRLGVPSAFICQTGVSLKVLGQHYLSVTVLDKDIEQQIWCVETEPRRNPSGGGWEASSGAERKTQCTQAVTQERATGVEPVTSSLGR